MQDILILITNKILKRNFYIFLLLFSVGYIIYYPTFFNGFQDKWDDQWVIKNYYTEGGLFWTNIKPIFLEFYHGQYSPINQLYYTALFSFFGYDLFIFHGLPVLLHIINCYLIYWISLKLLRFSPNIIIDSKYYEYVSLLTAFLFLINPISVESIAWLSASKVVLYTFFYLLATLCYLQYIIKKKYIYYVLIFFLYALSFGSKEQAVTLPVLFILIDYIFDRNLTSKKVIYEKLPFLILTLLFGFITILSQAAVDDGVFSNDEQYSFIQRLVFASYSLFEYLTKSVFPIKLSYIYPFPNLIGEPIPIRFWIYPIILSFMLFLLIKSEKNRWLYLGILFFVLHLSVALHIIPMARFAITADRYLYLALISVCFLISIVFVKYSQKLNGTKKFILFSGLLVYICFLSLSTFQRTKIWYSSDSLKKDLINIIKERKDYEQLRSRNGKVVK